MSIYISKNNQQAGPFEEAKVLQMLGSGQLLPNDLAIRHGQQQWQTLGALLPHSFQRPVRPALRATPIDTPRMKKQVAGGIYMTSLILLVLGLLVAGVMIFYVYDSRFAPGRNDGLVFGSIGIAILAYLQFMIVHIIFLFYLLSRMWGSIQDGISTSTGKAIGFLFIPVFSIYWIFKAWGGFPAEYNEFIERHGLNVPRLAGSVYLMVPIFALLSMFVLPLLAIPFILLAVISQTADAVNQLNRGLQNKQAGNNQMVEPENERLLSPWMRNAFIGLAGILVITLIGLGGFGWWNLHPSPGKDDLPETVGQFSKTQYLKSEGNFFGSIREFGTIYESADKKKAFCYFVRVTGAKKELSSYDISKRGKITDSNGNEVGAFVFRYRGPEMEVFNGSQRILIWDLNRTTASGDQVSTPCSSFYKPPDELKKEGKLSTLTEAEMLDFARSLPVNSQLKF